MSKKQINNQKPKKKKGFGFLIFLFAVVVNVASAIGCTKLGRHIAETKLEQQVGCPFTFEEEGDFQQHVTSDFSVANSFVDENGKEHKVYWKSNCKSVISVDRDGNATVTPYTRNITVTLTETCRFLGFYATRDYQFVVVTDFVQSYSADQLVTVESVANQTYDNEMTIRSRADGTVRSYSGDFGSVTVNNEADALAYIELYRAQLGIPEEITFKLGNFDASDLLANYTFEAYYQDVLLEGENVTLVVSNTTYQPEEILNGISSDVLPTDATYTPVDIVDCMPVIMNYYGISDLLYEDCGAVIVDGIYYQKILVSENVEDGFGWYVYIDSQTMSVAFEDFGFDGADSSTIEGVDERGNSITVDAEGVTIPTVYNLDGAFVDDGRNITVNFIGAAPSDDGVLGEEWAPKLESMYALEGAYDFYYSSFGRDSFDGNGREIILDFDTHDYLNREHNWFGEKFYVVGPNNAAWQQFLKKFYVTEKPDVYQFYSTNDYVVLYHEYTHAVFDSVTAPPSNINEGYADVLACLGRNLSVWRIGGNFYVPGTCLDDYNYTCDGTEECFMRDLVNIDLVDFSAIAAPEKYFPHYYDEDGFENIDPHNQGILIGHLGYQMYASGRWSRDELANIWYQSMFLGYDSESTFVDVRRNIIKTMDDLGYSKEDQDFVATECDAMHIFDEDYTYTTVQTEGNAIEGNPILDDTTTNHYLIFYSPAQIFYNGGTVYIYETTENDYDNLTDDEIEEAIETKINSHSQLHDYAVSACSAADSIEQFVGQISGSSVDLGGNTTEIQVEYRRVSETEMEIVRSFLTDHTMTIDGYIAQAAGSNADITEDSGFGLVRQFAYQFYSVDSTAYDFYRGL